MTLPYGDACVTGPRSDALRRSVDASVVSEFRFFLEKINERNLFTRGLVPKYEAPSPALGEEVEYFSSQITLDDRMQYIMRNIVTHPTLSEYNKIGNTIISHFYGARGIHSVITGESDPSKAHVDFEMLASELMDYNGEYTLLLQENMAKARLKKVPIWGTTELHTSIMGAGNAHVRMQTMHKRSDLAVAQWIASWITTGFMDKLLVSKSLKEMFTTLIVPSGIGPYYGYHCATSNSVNPNLDFSHDEPFCSPGPGAVMTLDLMFPGLSKKEVPYGDRVIWLRENQDEIFPGLRETFHPETFNVTANGVKIFDHDQDELKVYGLEVSLCQYSVYCRLRDNPHLISRRKIARAELSSEVELSQFFE